MEEVEGQVREGLRRQVAQLKEKKRLIREILQLQQLTGKLFIVQAEEESPAEGEALQAPPLLKKQE